MKCVCRGACQVRMPSGKIRFFEVGKVEEFDKCPTGFEAVALEEGKVDFLVAEKDELLEAVWKLADARKTVKKEYGVVLKQGKKADIVAQILDARYRSLGVEPNKVV